MCDDGVRSFVPNVLCWGVTTHDWFTLLDVLDIWRNISCALCLLLLMQENRSREQSIIFGNTGLILSISTDVNRWIAVCREEKPTI